MTEAEKRIEAVAWKIKEIAKQHLAREYQTEIGYCHAIRAALADPLVTESIWPAEPTEEMLNAVCPFPEHLRAEHPDPTDPWHISMWAATKADQMTVRSQYKAMRAAAIRSLGDKE